MVNIAPEIPGELSYERKDRIAALNQKELAVFAANQRMAYAHARREHGHRNRENAAAFDNSYRKAQVYCEPILLK